MRCLSPLVLLLAPLAAQAALPPVPTPPGNPSTPARVLLGKALFWDEQLSSDQTVACGTCHQPEAGGGDPRFLVAAGDDGITGTPDDVRGSPGVLSMDADGFYTAGATSLQVTGRAAPSAFGALWSPLQFWDGRAGPSFADPWTGLTLFADRAGLEAQAVGPILNDAEMAHPGRTWDDVVARIDGATPLALAPSLTPDLAAALSPGVLYGDLFDAAFGDPAVTPARIGQALAAYERTLVADETPWDLFVAGDAGALSAQEQRGLAAFQGTTCAVCHGGPTFTDNSFRNIGLRPIGEDEGRGAITGVQADDGRFKVPTLRNVALRERFMHNGQFGTLRDAVAFYVNRAAQFTVGQDPLVRGVVLPPAALDDVVAFLQGGLTDPRAAAGVAPFDHPGLHAALDACHDGRDNDGDGRADLADGGCAVGADTSELDHLDPCDDGLDNDGDGEADDADCDGGAFEVAVVGLVAGRTATISVTGAAPGASVLVFSSVRGVGAGPCHPTLPLCLDLVGPRTLGTAVADAAGFAELTIPVPLSVAPGTSVWLQAAWLSGGDGAASDVITAVVR